MCEIIFVGTDSLTGSDTAFATIPWSACFTEDSGFHLSVIKASTDWKAAKSDSH